MSEQFPSLEYLTVMDLIMLRHQEKNAPPSLQTPGFIQAIDAELKRRDQQRTEPAQ